jgi:excisionase family DNA binding protein
VIATPAAASLDLEAAAAFVGLHRDTLRERAAAGIIPGAKVGKEWRFLDVDLVAYLRSQYKCPSTSDQAQTSGTSTSAGLDGLEFDALLERATESQRSASTTNLRLVSGNRSRPGSNSPTHSPRGSRRGRAAGKN